MKHLRLEIFVLMSLLTLLTAGCDKGGEVIYNDDPYIASHLRYMLKEPTSVALACAPKNAEVTIDFGDGFSQRTVGSTSVTHIYEEPGDYNITVSWSDKSLERTVRVYPLVALSEAMKQFKDSKYKGVWVMAHRAHTTDRSIPENSCSAVKAAIAAGADIVECDTQITADGVVVVCHDPTINATTTGTGDITQLTLSQIKSFNLKDRNGNVTAEKMPTLEEYLKTARGKVYVNMDYSPRTASTSQVYEVVSKLDMLEQVFFYCETEEKANECFSLNPNCQVYAWHKIFKVFDGHPGVYFIQANSNSSDVDPAAASSAVLSVNMKSVTDGSSSSTIKTEIEELFTKFPGCRMFQTDNPAGLVTYLEQQGKR